MTLSKFLTYWSLLFAILTFWGFSILVASADVKDELLAKFKARWLGAARAKPAPADPLAGRTIAETMTARPLTEPQRWVLDQVAPVHKALGLGGRTLVLEDPWGHFVVYLTLGKRLVTYRLDKAWVADARAGKADQLERIRRAAERYLRQEVLGERVEAPAPGAPPRPAASSAPPAPSAPAPAPGSAPAAAEMSREEKIAAARAKVEALRTQRAASGAAAPGGTPASAGSASEGSAAGARPEPDRSSAEKATDPARKPGDSA